jgi:hypothetical protein
MVRAASSADMRTSASTSCIKAAIFLTFSVVGIIAVSASIQAEFQLTEMRLTMFQKVSEGLEGSYSYLRFWIPQHRDDLGEGRRRQAAVCLTESKLNFNQLCVSLTVLQNHDDRINRVLTDIGVYIL